MPLKKEGPEAVVKSPGQPFDEEEALGGRCPTAVYPDETVAKVCIACHEDHQDSPRRDIEMGDATVGIVPIPRNETAMHLGTTVSI
ncbi:hypothetical protein [Pelomicrobium sp.]|jgi:hypothetical protein|uniref:hypothetical protein n=1 Tax=Pelomicrobium sp. TaxID=2815319 RepID=UPI002FDF09D5